MVTITPSKAPRQPQKEGMGGKTEDSDETVGSAQANPTFEEGGSSRGQATQNQLQEVNLGSDEEPRHIFISGNMSPNKKGTYLEFLKQNRYVFTWTYLEITGLDLTIAMCRLAIKLMTPDETGP